MQDDALVEVIRAGQVESRHQISFALVDGNGDLRAAWGDPDLVTFLRSSAKPFQAIPFVESGAADHFHFQPRDIALVCASHSGTDMHVEAARRILEKIGVPESALRCGVHIPYDEKTYINLLRGGEDLKPIRNNCSGKHAGMLALAKYLDEDLATYLDQRHPAQKQILQVILEMTGVPDDAITVGVDGCSAPTFALPLRAAARAYARLVARGDQTSLHAQAARRIVEAMTAHPEYVAGPNRFDTIFMQAVNGRMVSKSGAEGFQAVGIPPGALGEGSPPLGLAIKVHDGDHKDHKAGAITAIELVDRLGGFRRTERESLKRFDTRELINLSGIIVGEVRANPAFKLEI
jgi:L-asparaginase II